MLAQNRLKMGAMRAEVAEEFQYFDFAGLLLRNRIGQYGVIDTFGQCGRAAGADMLLWALSAGTLVSACLPQAANANRVNEVKAKVFSFIGISLHSNQWADFMAFCWRCVRFE